MIDRDMDRNCVQGGSEPGPNFQRMEPGSPRATRQIGAPRATTTHQPMEQDDSGVASGSDCHSSSPGSDSYQHGDRIRFNSTPIIPNLYGINPYSHPLTPPTSEPLVSPKSEEEEKDATLTPCASPHDNNTENNHLKRLEMTLERNLRSSPRMSENSTDGFRSDNDVEELDESFRTPKVNSRGKVKTFKCKQCDHVAYTKEDKDEHRVVHIPEDKRLYCPKCRFVAAHKQHFELHLLNHSGSKPFKCTECDYACVNKAMLNSHKKSHSAIYRYRCKDCGYKTKYCHPLKAHLRRYKHLPDVVLDSEGRPDPDAIIDVYGSRRGPKTKSQPRNEEQRPLPQPCNLNVLPGPSQGIPLTTYPFLEAFSNPLLLEHLLRQQALAAVIASSLPERAPEPELETLPEDSVLNLSRPGCSGMQAKKSRRKGSSPCKMDMTAVESDSDSDCDDDDATTTMFANVEAIIKKEEVEERPTSDSNNNNKEEKSCKYCDITFGDVIMYSIHMGHHGFQNPFTCNMCGAECSDRLTFFLHIAHVAHS